MIENFSTPLLIITALAAATTVGVWVSLILWTVKDIRSRTKDKLSVALAIVSVTILSFAGFLIYLILRPKFTIEQSYQTALEEEALLESIEHKNRCSNCGNTVNQDWQFCPYCETQLKTNCTGCGFLLKPAWSICPICGSNNKSESVSAETNLMMSDPDQIFEETSNDASQKAPIVDEPETLIEENDFDTL